MTKMQVNYVYFALVLFLSILLLITGRIMVTQSYSSGIGEVGRIEVEEARQKILTGDSLFVCAYDGIEKYRSVALEGSISLSSFKEVLKEIPLDKEIIFY